MQKYIKIREENQQLCFREFEIGRIDLESKPLLIHIELTQHCNFKCSMCRPTFRTNSTQTMDIELFRRLASELFPTAKIIDLRGWGESTLLPNFLDFVKITKKYDLAIKILTNGSAQNPKMWRYLIKNKVIIGVSIDAGSQNLFEKIRSGADFLVIKENVNLMTSTISPFNAEDDQIYFLTTVQRKNLFELKQIVDLAVELNVSLIKLSPIQSETDIPELLENVPLSTIKDVVGKVNAYAKRKGVKLEYLASLGKLKVENCSNFPKCIHPWMYAYINYKGQLGYCDHLIGSYRKFSVDWLNKDGNDKNSFLKVWNHNKFRSIRRAHTNYRKNHNKSSHNSELNSICKWCYSHRYVDFEDWVYPHFSKFKCQIEEELV